MKKVFISYARSHQRKADEVCADISRLGYVVWLDGKLTGGQIWWDEILEQIRSCDIFAILVSEASCTSQACMREVSYADALGKTLLPIIISPDVSPGTLPPLIGEIQLLNYFGRERDTVIELAKALIASRDSGSLPNPLPNPPDIPLSYLGKIAEALNREALSLEEQQQILFTIKDGLKDEALTQDASQVLKRLRDRRDLYKVIDNEIATLYAMGLAPSHVPPSSDASQAKILPSQKTEQRSLLAMLVGCAWGLPFINLIAAPAIVIWLHYFSKKKLYMAGPFLPWIAYLLLLWLLYSYIGAYIPAGVIFGIFYAYRVNRLRG